ncbi:MAG: hypothetical protein KTR29_08130 [Rhodothermaceae bacterium]|nr:hypothetical protein [Rhodothermaceae bacterium]
MDLLSSLRLSNMPVSVKLLFTAVLMTLGTGYIFALANVALKVGFSSEEVALKYYGNEPSRQVLRDIERAESATEEGGAGVVEGEAFSFDSFDEELPVQEEPIVSIPSLEALVSEGHFHLFGYTTIFFLCGLILVFAEVPSFLKNTLIIAPFVASVLDIWSMLLTRFVGPGFAWLLMVSGMVMALSFLMVFVIGIYQLWFLHPKETAK